MKLLDLLLYTIIYNFNRVVTYLMPSLPPPSTLREMLVVWFTIYLAPSSIFIPWILSTVTSSQKISWSVSMMMGQNLWNSVTLALPLLLLDPCIQCVVHLPMLHQRLYWRQGKNLVIKVDVEYHLVREMYERSLSWINCQYKID